MSFNCAGFIWFYQIYTIFTMWFQPITYCCVPGWRRQTVIILRGTVQHSSVQPGSTGGELISSALIGWIVADVDLNHAMAQLAWPGHWAPTSDFPFGSLDFHLRLSWLRLLTSSYPCQVHTAFALLPSLSMLYNADFFNASHMPGNPCVRLRRILKKKLRWWCVIFGAMAQYTQFFVSIPILYYDRMMAVRRPVVRSTVQPLP